MPGGTAMGEPWRRSSPGCSEALRRDRNLGSARRRAGCLGELLGARIGIAAADLGIEALVFGMGVEGVRGRAEEGEAAGHEDDDGQHQAEPESHGSTARVTGQRSPE